MQINHTQAIYKLNNNVNTNNEKKNEIMNKKIHNHESRFKNIKKSFNLRRDEGISYVSKIIEGKQSSIKFSEKSLKVQNHSKSSLRTQRFDLKSILEIKLDSRSNSRKPPSTHKVNETSNFNKILNLDSVRKRNDKTEVEYPSNFMRSEIKNNSFLKINQNSFKRKKLEFESNDEMEEVPVKSKINEFNSNNLNFKHQINNSQNFNNRLFFSKNNSLEYEEREKAEIKSKPVNDNLTKTRKLSYFLNPPNISKRKFSQGLNYDSTKENLSNQNKKNENMNSNYKINNSPLKDEKILKYRPFSQLQNKENKYSQRIINNYVNENSEKSKILTARQKNNYHTTSINTKDDKKKEVIRQISNFDDKKIKKLAKLIEVCDNIDILNFKSTNIQNGKSKHLETPKTQHINKYNINYIHTDNINFGNINIQVNNNTSTNNNISNTKSNQNKNKYSKKNNYYENVILNSNLKSSLSSSKIIDNEIFSQNKRKLIAEDILISPFKSNIKNGDFILNFKDGINTQISNYSVISINILSNWGNKEKVGITEMQIFDRKNKKINIIECYVFNGNEESIPKIHNNKYNTTEESDMWTSTFKNSIKIEIYFEAIHDVDYMILWNYNGKDLSKGVKDVEIYKKNIFVWKGRINKGIYNTKTNYSTTIHLNSNLNKDKYKFEINENEKFKRSKERIDYKNNIFSKTSTIEPKPFSSNNTGNEFINLNDIYKKYPKDDMKLTSLSHHSNDENLNIEFNEIPSEIYFHQNSRRNTNSNLNSGYKNKVKLNEVLKKSKSMNSNEVFCKSLKIFFLQNWGNSSFIGFNKLEFFERNRKKIDENLIRLLNFHPLSQTTYDDNTGYIWEYNKQNPVFIEVSFERSQYLTAINIWNYNSFKETDIGIKQFDIIIENDLDNSVTEYKNILIRRNLGVEGINLFQTIKIPFLPNMISQDEIDIINNFSPAKLKFVQDFDTPYLPCGFILKITLLSNFGDDNFIGLREINLFDLQGLSILKNYNFKYFLFPSDKDQSSENGFEYFEEENENKMEFLFKYSDPNNSVNFNEISKDKSIIFVFERPVIISMISFLNINQEQKIGVKEIMIHLDENIIYKGNLNISNQTNIFFTSEHKLHHGNEDIFCLPSKKTISKNENQTYFLLVHSDNTVN